MDEPPEPVDPAPQKEIPAGYEQFQKPPPSEAPPQSGMEYAADKIGFVPNIRKDDNKFQAKAVLLGIVLGVTIFLICNWWPWWASVTVGVVSGMFVSTLISGFILAVRGLKC